MLAESPPPPLSHNVEGTGPALSQTTLHLGRMALFAVNTGLRDSNVCGLQWTWEVVVPEVRRSVFVIPAEAFIGRLRRHRSLADFRYCTGTSWRKVPFSIETRPPTHNL
jgi:hypothetical protein